MKITTEHYNHIKKHFAALAENPNRPIATHREHLQRMKPGKDIEKLLRWNILWSCALSGWISDNIYHCANDDHIDTALKKIMKEIN